MQLILTLAADPFVLPINYRRLIQGLIYAGLSGDPEYSAAVHDLKIGGARPFKGFTFSPLTGRYSVEDDLIRFTGDVRLEIRSFLPKTIAILYHYFMSAGQVALGNRAVAVTGCLLRDRRITGEEITVRSLSPIVSYRTEEDRFVTFHTPEEDVFYRALELNAKRKAGRFQLPVDFDLHIEPVPGAPVKKQIAYFKKSLIVGWFCSLRLTGNPLILDMLYQTGLGSKNSEGFGLFDVDPPPAPGTAI